MDPMTWGAAIGGLLTLLLALVGFLKHKRLKRERLAQSEVDALKAQLDHPTVEPDPAKRLYVGKPKG